MYMITQKDFCSPATPYIPMLFRTAYIFWDCEPWSKQKWDTKAKILQTLLCLLRVGYHQMGLALRFTKCVLLFLYLKSWLNLRQNSQWITWLFNSSVSMTIFMIQWKRLNFTNFQRLKMFSLLIWQLLF